MIHFATIGTSKITDRFISAGKQDPEFVLQAVYSRTPEGAEAFREKHGAASAYSDLEALAADPLIDAVYIGSPNSAHCSQAVFLMEHGKNILCEKSMSANHIEALFMIEAAERNHVLLLEAMRSLYDPGYEKIRMNLQKIGTVRRANIRYCQYSSRYDAFRAGETPNIFRTDCAAGSLMDIGVYCVEPMIDLFGTPEKINTSSVIIRGGIDGTGTILAHYPEMTAELIYSKITDSHMPSEIQGEDGVMEITSITDPRKIVIHNYKGGEEIIEDSECPNNMIYEASAFIKFLNEFKETGVIPADVRRLQMVSLRSMQLMTEARQQSGIVFPADKS